MASLGNELGNPLGNVLGNPLSGGVGASYQAILGPLLVEMWHSQLGIATVSGNVDTWTGQIGGRVLAAAAAINRPAYAADGANFRGRPVVNTANSGSKGLISSANLSPPLLAAGTKPTIWMCCRLRTISVLNNQFMQCVDNPVTRSQPSLFALASALEAQDGTTNAIAAAYTDTTVHSYAASYSSAGAIRVLVDGAVLATAGTGLSVQGGVAKISIGAAFNGTSASDGSFATVLVISSQPSPAQIAALLALDKATWGF